MGPRKCDGGGIRLHIKRLQFAAKFAGLAAFFVAELGKRKRSGGLGTCVSHAEKVRLSAASAGAEIHRAVIADDRIREIQRRLAAFAVERFWRDEVFERARVARAVRFQVNRHQPPVSPVADIERLLVFRGKFRAGAEDHAGRAADADIHRSRHAVRIILRPLRAAFAEALVAAAHALKRACGPIPRAAPVPFHVAIVAEQLAVRIERDVVIVALPGRKHLHVFSIEVHARHVAAGRFRACAESVSILDALEREVVRVVAMRRCRREILRHSGKISAHRVEHLVRPEHETVRAVFARAALPLAEKLHVVKTIVLLSVLAAIQRKAATAFTANIKHIAHEQHPHRLAHRNVHHLGIHALAVLQRHPRNRLPALTAEQQPPFRILRHANPRAIRLFFSAQDVLDFETGERVEDFAGILRQQPGHHRLRAIRRSVDCF